MKRVLATGRRLYSTRLLKDAGHSWAHLKSRALLRIEGPDTLLFLQGLITNDATYLAPGPKQVHALAALLLNTSGRVMDDVILYNCSDSGTDVVLECSRENYKFIADTFLKYRLRKKVDFQNCSDSLGLYAVFPNVETLLEPPDEESVRSLVGTVSDIHMRNNRGSVAAVSDPRLLRLGTRIIAPPDDEPHFYMPIGRDREKSEQEYRLARYAFGVAEGPPEVVSGKSLPLECNADYLNAISFHKGCYIGQELTARTHHVGVVRKRIMPLFFSISTQVEFPFGAEIKNESGKNVGYLRGSFGRFGIGLMRVEETLSASSLTLETESGGVSCQSWKPSWWASSDEIGRVRGFSPQ